MRVFLSADCVNGSTGELISSSVHPSIIPDTQESKEIATACVVNLLECMEKVGWKDDFRLRLRRKVWEKQRMLRPAAEAVGETPLPYLPHLEMLCGAKQEGRAARRRSRQPSQHGRFKVVDSTHESELRGFVTSRLDEVKSSLWFNMTDSYLHSNYPTRARSHKRVSSATTNVTPQPLERL